jgi:hypothetical protein
MTDPVLRIPHNLGTSLGTGPVRCVVQTGRMSP